MFAGRQNCCLQSSNVEFQIVSNSIVSICFICDLFVVELVNLRRQEVLLHHDGGRESLKPNLEVLIQFTTCLVPSYWKSGRTVDSNPRRSGFLSIPAVPTSSLASCPLQPLDAISDGANVSVSGGKAVTLLKKILNN